MIKKPPQRVVFLCMKLHNKPEVRISKIEDRSSKKQKAHDGNHELFNSTQPVKVKEKYLCA
jgi:hypothetical protein